MLQKILSEFLQIEGVTTAALVGSDGFVIEYTRNDTFDIDALAALASDAVRFFSRAGPATGMGAPRQIVLEQKDGAIIICPLTDDELLVVVANTRLMLGRLTHELPKIRMRVAAAI